MSGSEIRLLGESDWPAWQSLCRLAFGTTTLQGAASDHFGRTDTRIWGSFDGGELIATATEQSFDSWFGGTRLRTAGVSAVVVRPECAGQGHLGRVLEALLADAQRRGAVISTLFPTSVGAYRRFGYESIVDLHTVEIPTDRLRAKGLGVVVTQARPEDENAILQVYRQWACTRNGPVDRTEHLNNPRWPAGSTTLVAVDSAGQLTGYLTWVRSPVRSSDGSEYLDILDWVSADVTSLKALLAPLGSLSPTASRVRLRSSGWDPIRTLVPLAHEWKITSSVPYMVKVLRPEEVLPSSGRVFTEGGLALSMAGSMSSPDLRRWGLMHGGDEAEDAVWDAALGGRPIQVSDYF